MTTSSRTRRTTARLAALLGALAIAAVAPATPAHAAGDTSKPDMYGCFTWGATVAYAGQPVYLQYWRVDSSYPNGHWVTSRSGNTNSSGCIRFNDISVGHYYHLYAQKVYGYPLCYYYAAETGYAWTTTGDTLWRTGTTYVGGPYTLC